MSDLMAQGRFSEAVHLGERARERHGELPRTDLYLATAQLFANDLETAGLTYRKHQDVELPLIIFLGVFPHTALGHIALAQGDPAAATVYLERGLRQDMDAVQRGRETWSFRYDAASIHALRGETDQALEWLGKAVEAGWRGWPFRDSPLFASLRGDPRYTRILEEVDRMVAEARVAAGVDR
jgi:tetratricopeptide (TPR) repeat protein